MSEDVLLLAAKGVAEAKDELNRRKINVFRDATLYLQSNLDNIDNQIAKLTAQRAEVVRGLERIENADMPNDILPPIFQIEVGGVLKTYQRNREGNYSIGG